jgi:hypothetical protein
MHVHHSHGGFIILFRASDSKTRESLQGDHRDENGTRAARAKSKADSMETGGRRCAAARIQR